MRDWSALVDVYLQERPQAASRPRAELLRALEEIGEAAVAAWPTFEVAMEGFVRHVARLTDGERMVSRDCAGDLYLAFACAAKHRDALRALDPILLAATASAIARIDSSPSFRDVVAQEVRTRLLLGDPPKIAEYAGHAPLRRWLKTVAARAALNLRRGKAEESRDSVGSANWTVAAGPDAALWRARFNAQFKDALGAALAKMSSRERAVLAMSVRDGMSIDKIAAVYGVGRSTAARWLQAAREKLEEDARAELVDRLKLTKSQFDSIAADVRSNLEVSLGEMLGDAADDR